MREDLIERLTHAHRGCLPTSKVHINQWEDVVLITLTIPERDFLVSALTSAEPRE